MIFDAAITVRDLDAQYNITIPDDPSYETVGGFVLSRLGFIPRGGESFESDGYLFTVMEMDRRRVSRVKIKPIRAAGPSLVPSPPPSAAAPPAPAPKPKQAGSRIQGASREMIRYLSVRVLLALPALWLIVTMVFLLAHIVPGDPVQQMLGEGARAEDLQQLRHSLGLDKPISVQYGHYLVGVLHGNLGESFRFQEPVTRVVLVALSSDARAGSRSAAGLHGDQHSRRDLCRRTPRHGCRPRRRRLHATGPVGAEFCARSRAHPDFFRDFRLAARFRAWRRCSSDSSGDHPRRRARGDLGAHGAQFGDRRAFERLRPHRARQGPLRIAGALPPRLPQRPDSDSHDPRLAVRDSPRRRHRHGNDFFVAGHRPPCRPGDFGARLSAVAGLHSADRGFLRGCESLD